MRDSQQTLTNRRLLYWRPFEVVQVERTFQIETGWSEEAFCSGSCQCASSNQHCMGDCGGTRNVPIYGTERRLVSETHRGHLTSDFEIVRDAIDTVVSLTRGVLWGLVALASIVAPIALIIYFSDF